MNFKLSPHGVNNFHNCAPLYVRVRGKTPDGYPVSARVAKRIEKHFCGVADCRCPAGGVVVQTRQSPPEFAIRA
jgi:hypothetical protein